MPGAAGWLEWIEKGKLDEWFARLYGTDTTVLQKQRERYSHTIKRFGEVFGATEDLQLFSVPGRTEICGNHTDHNNGKVMAAAVDLDIIAVVEVTGGSGVQVRSEGFAYTDSVDLAYLKPVSHEFGKSAGLVRGVAAGISQRGGTVGGFNAYTSSNVLKGSGLSSSAAFEICIAAIFNHIFNKGRFSPVELGIIGQYAENRFFGKPSGLMDQTVCAVGGAVTIDFRDVENPVVGNVPFDPAQFGHSLVITDTLGSHASLTDEYAAIRMEMVRVAEYFGKDVLAQLDEEQLVAALAPLRKATGDRAVLRALHFFAECHRVEALVAASTARDFDECLRIIGESGHSSYEYNQNVYVSTDTDSQPMAIGLALSQRVLGRRGAYRMQGGGFAGTIQAFVPADLLQDYCTALEEVFGTGTCHVLSVRRDGAVQLQV